MTSCRGSCQRARWIDAVPVRESRWLLSSLWEEFDWYLKVPHLRWRCRRHVVLLWLTPPPVINGGDVREDVTPREICWKWIRAGCWEGQQPWIEKRGGEEGKRCLSARVNGLALNWLVCFVFKVKWIFIIFYVMTNRLIIRWKINAGNNWFFFSPSSMTSIRVITCYC